MSETSERADLFLRAYPVNEAKRLARELREADRYSDELERELRDLDAKLTALNTEQNRWRRAYECAAERGRRDARRARRWRAGALYGLALALCAWGAVGHQLGLVGAGLTLALWANWLPISEEEEEGGRRWDA